MVNGYGDLGLSTSSSSLPVFRIGHHGKIYGKCGKFARNAKEGYTNRTMIFLWNIENIQEPVFWMEL